MLVFHLFYRTVFSSIQNGGAIDTPLVMFWPKCEISTWSSPHITFLSVRSSLCVYGSLFVITLAARDIAATECKARVRIWRYKSAVLECWRLWEAINAQTRLTAWFTHDSHGSVPTRFIPCLARFKSREIPGRKISAVYGLGRATGIWDIENLTGGFG